jgi:PKD repeat protein
LIAFSFAMQSCRKSPFACFTTSVNIDSIRVNVPVTFNALCSSYAGSYNWQFGSGDSADVQFNAVVTETFKDTGDVDVYLLVTNGGKQNSTDETIHVHP